MIDPLAVALAYLRADADLRLLVGDRVALQHRYGLGTAATNAWGLGQDGLVLSPISGAVPDNAGQARLRVDARAYGDTAIRAMAIINRLRAISDAFVRAEVPLPNGDIALLYLLVVDDSPEYQVDPDVQASDGLRMSVVRQPMLVWTHSQRL